MGHQVGVALDEVDVVDAHSQPVGGDHGEGGHVALAVAERTRVDPGPALWGDLHPPELIAAGCRPRCHLHVGGDADAHLQRPAVGPPPGLLGPQFVVAGRLEDQIQAGLVVAAVVLGANAGGDRKVLRLEEVTTPQLDRIHADLSGEELHGTLHRQRGLGATRPPVCLSGRGVGYDRTGPRLDVGDVVDADRHRKGEHRQEGPEPRVGPTVNEHVQPVVGHVTVAGAADDKAVHVPSTRTHGVHVLGPGLKPPDRTTHRCRQPRQEDVLRVRRDFGAETAAHVRHDHLDAARGLLAVQSLQRHLHAMRPLVGHPDDELVALPCRRRGTGLDRSRSRPLVRDPSRDNSLAAGEEGVVGDARGHAQVREVDGHVGAHRWVHDNLVGDGVLGIHHHR